MNRCSYCGNSSGQRDSRGMCISCGGNLGEDSISAPYQDLYPPPLDYQHMNYSDFSGSSYGFPMIGYYKGKPIDLLDHNELIEMREYFLENSLLPKWR